MAKKKPKVEPEHIAQVKVVRHLRSRGVEVFAVPNGAMLGGNRWGQMNKLKAEGLLPGAPDLVCVRMAYIVDGLAPVAIEMKAPGEKLSDAQIAVHAELKHEGWHVIVGYGSADAIAKIDELRF